MTIHTFTITLKKVVIKEFRFYVKQNLTKYAIEIVSILEKIFEILLLTDFLFVCLDAFLKEAKWVSHLPTN